MRIDRHAAAVIDDAQISAFLQGDFDEGGVAGDRFIHRIVDHFSEKVMQRIRIGAADVHSGTSANGLQPLEHFDRSSVIGGFAGRAVLCGLRDEDGAGVGSRRTPASLAHRLTQLCGTRCFFAASTLPADYQGLVF